MKQIPEEASVVAMMGLFAVKTMAAFSRQTRAIASFTLVSKTEGTVAPKDICLHMEENTATCSANIIIVSLLLDENG